MYCYKVVVFISVIEIELNSTFVANHVSDTHSLCVSLNFSMEVGEFGVIVLGKANKENLPHLGMLDVLELLALHIILKLFTALLLIFDLLKSYNNKIMPFKLWKHMIIIWVLYYPSHVPSASQDLYIVSFHA